jgi:hypothetical protein
LFSSVPAGAIKRGIPLFYLSFGEGWGEESLFINKKNQNGFRKKLFIAIWARGVGGFMKQYPSNCT